MLLSRGVTHPGGPLRRLLQGPRRDQTKAWSRAVMVEAMRKEDSRHVRKQT